MKQKSNFVYKDGLLVVTKASLAVILSLYEEFDEKQVASHKLSERLGVAYPLWKEFLESGLEHSKENIESFYRMKACDYILLNLDLPF